MLPGKALPPSNKINLWSLAASLVKDHEELVAVKYFSAYATWHTGKYRRHQKYTADLEKVGVTTIMGYFRHKDVICPKCRHQWQKPEEKETDVHIGLKMLEDAMDGEFDRALLISADSDLVPVVRSVKRRFPEKTITVVAPPGRI